MRIYELPTGSKIKIPTDEYPGGEMFSFERVDGSYTVCSSDQTMVPASTALRRCCSRQVRAVIQPKAYLEVVKVDDHWEIVSDRCPTPKLPRAIAI